MYRLLSRYTWPLILIAISLGLAGVPAVHAQGETTLINIGENKIGEVTAEQPTPAYLLTVFEPQPVDIQVLAVSQGFAPALRVRSGRALAQEATNTGSATVAQIKSLEVTAGVYRIEVASANGQLGQFVLGIQAGEPLPHPRRWSGAVARRRREQRAPRQRTCSPGWKRTRCCCT